VFINGNHIGGCDDTFRLHRNSKLVPMLKWLGRSKIWCPDCFVLVLDPFSFFSVLKWSWIGRCWDIILSVGGSLVLWQSWSLAGVYLLGFLTFHISDVVVCHFLNCRSFWFLKRLFFCVPFV
jgi:hypothetical protein